MKKTNACVFRVSAVLAENIDPATLQRAAETTISRFPTMAVKLKTGVFWAYLYENTNPLVVQAEATYPCMPIMGDKETNEYLFKIMYFKRRISLECFHAITDGTGAMEFLKSLVYQYLLLMGKDVRDDGLILLPEGVPQKEEEEDGCLKYHDEHARTSKVEMRKARAIQGTLLKNRGTHVVHGVIPSSAFKEHARRHGTTVTGYLAAVFAQAISLADSQQGYDKYPIQIGIPVNLRKFFPSKTLRNFVSQVSVNLPASSGQQDFGDMVESVTAQMEATLTQENLSARIATYVSYEKMLGVRLIPWFLKKAVISFISQRANNAVTSVMTNLGCIKLPPSMEKHILMMEVLLPSQEAASISCGVCSVNDKLNISFTGNTVESDVVRRFFELLHELTELDIDVYSNGWIENDTVSMNGIGSYPVYPAQPFGRKERNRVILPYFHS